MRNLLIEDIKKIKMIYEINDVNNIKGKGYARLDAFVTLSEDDLKEKYRKANVTFEFMLRSKGSEEKENSHDNVGAKLELIYKVVFNQEDKNINIDDSDLLYYIEPYARREINDMLNEIGLPVGILPYGFWENDK